MSTTATTKSIARLVLVGLVVVVALLASAPAEAASRPPVKFGGACRIVALDADHDNGVIERIAARHGGVDYRGRLAFADRVGRWTTNDNGKVFGYSVEEDSIIYSTAFCALVRPAYL